MPEVALIGVPWDAASSFMRGSALAPDAIRAALRCESANGYAENGVDVVNHPLLRDAGNIRDLCSETDYLDIEKEISVHLAKGVRVFSLGGDHSITYPLARAYRRYYPDFDLLQLDAHADTYDVFDEKKYSHACPFARIMEEKISRRLVQIGIRALTTHQREQAARFGIETIEMRNWSEGCSRLEFTRPVYISLDLDVLDPAFAPGVSHHEPGGASTRDVIGVIQSIRAPVIGCDLVEYNPQRDLMGMTGMVAAKLARELLAQLFI